MKGRLAAALAAVLLMVPLLGHAAERYRVSLCSDYDLDSATLVYVATWGYNDAPLSGPIARRVFVTTSGSSTSVTAAAVGSAPFQGIVAGDELYFNLGGLETARVITAKTDNDNVTVDTAIDLSTPIGFSWRQFVVGGAATDGWIPVTGFEVASFCYQLAQSDGGSIDVQVEAQNTGVGSSYPQVVAADNFTSYGCATAAAGCKCVTINPNLYDRARLGMKITTDTSDAGAAVEKISAQFIGVRSSQ